MSKYDKLTNEEFDRRLFKIADKYPASWWATEYGDIYEVIAEALNNDVLNDWEAEQKDEKNS